MAKPISIADMFKGYKGLSFPTSPGMDFATTTRQLPNNAGTFNSVTSVTPKPGEYGSVDYVSPTVPIGHLFGETPDKKGDWAFPQPVVQTPPPPQPDTPPAKPNVPPQYINPATGQMYSAQEIVDNLAKKLPISKPPTGDIPTYAGDQAIQGPQTERQIVNTATDLNNARNDIATGTTDPYKINQSGIVYSPEQLQAIRSAYAGVYDPALKDVFTKLEIKKKEEEQKTADQRMRDEIKLRTDEAIREYNATTKLRAEIPTPAEEKGTLEKMIWGWLASAEATAMTKEEKISKIMGWGADPKTFGFEYFQQ